jgi:hypothetical protein
MTTTAGWASDFSRVSNAYLEALKPMSSVAGGESQIQHDR